MPSESSFSNRRESQRTTTNLTPDAGVLALDQLELSKRLYKLAGDETVNATKLLASSEED